MITCQEMMTAHNLSKAQMEQMLNNESLFGQFVEIMTIQG